MEVKQSDLLKALSILVENPDLIKSIIDGSLNDSKETEYIPSDFYVNYHLSHEKSSLFKEILDGFLKEWEERPKSLEDLFLTVSLLSEEQNGQPVKILKVLVNDKNSDVIYGFSYSANEVTGSVTYQSTLDLHGYEEFTDFSPIINSYVSELIEEL